MRYHEIDRHYERQVQREREEREATLAERREQQRQELVRLEGLRRRQAAERCIERLAGMKIE